MPVVVGIDLAAGRGITEVAALIADSEGRHPVFDAACHQRVTTDNEIVAVVASAQPIVVAVDAPLTLPRAVVRGLNAEPENDRNHGSEASVPNAAGSPYTRAAERDPIWSTLGIRPLPVSFLGGLTFRAISLLPQLRAAAPSADIIEVFPGATLRRFGIMQSAGGRKAAKTTETSRRIVQCGLRTLIGGIPSPEDEIYGADLLDALAVALTGVAYVRGEYLMVGDMEEGIIILPT